MINFDFKVFYNNIQKDFLEAYNHTTYLERYKYMPEMVYSINNDDECSTINILT